MPKFTELPGASPPGPPPGLCPGPAGGLTAPPAVFFGSYGRATTKMLPTGLNTKDFPSIRQLQFRSLVVRVLDYCSWGPGFESDFFTSFIS